MHPRTMDRGVTAHAVLALALCSLAVMPLAGADTDPRPWDATGPSVTAITIDPSPVVPDLVKVRGIASDMEGNVTFAEFWIDVPGPNGTSFFRMRPADGAFNSPSEGLLWVGPYFTFTQGIATGFHDLRVHAIDLEGNWGPYASLPFFVGDPSNTGPTVTSATATPEDLPLGTPLAVEAFAHDPFLGGVVAAEFFLDLQGPDGTGTPMDPLDRVWGGPDETVDGTGIAGLTPGAHAVYVHAMNDRGLWGSPAGTGVTVRAPALSLSVATNPGELRPGETALYTILVENHGNAAATEAWIDMTFATALAFLGDDASASGGTHTGPTSWRFANVSAPVSFDVRLLVLNATTDGIDLRADGVLDFTNENGWDFDSVPAIATVVALAPELRLDVTAPAVVYAGEAFDLVVDLVHSGIRAIPTLEVGLASGGLASPVNDNAASLGGAFVNGFWRFSDLAPGSHRLVVTERVSPEASDLAIARQGITVRYLSRGGTMILLQASAESRLERPDIALAVDPRGFDVLAGEQVTFLVDYVNRGSAAAGSVDLEVTVPAGLALVGGDPPDITAGSHHSWRFSDVEPGQRGRVIVVFEARAQSAAGLLFDLAYTSPNGAFLARVAAPASVAVSPIPAPPLLNPTMAVVAVAGSSAALLGVALTERGKSGLLFLLFVPLYTRLRHDKVLDHETRGMIRGYIVANPGDHYNSIKEALELPNGTLAYHIQVLQKEMIVRSVKDGKFRRFYPAEMRVPEGGEPTKIQKVILDLIRANPGITPRDAAGLLGLSSSTVSYHLEKLAEHERVEYRREGITKRLYVRGDLEIP